MRVLIVSIFFSISCYSQTNLQFDKVDGNDISSCQESANGKICQSKLPLEIWLTRAALLVGKYETITLSFDGDKWKAKYYNGDWIRNTIDTFNLRPIHNYDTIFAALKKNRIFLLPDQKELTLKGGVDDGYDYTLTFKADNKFRTYEFSNPDIYRKYNDNISELENYVNIINILFSWLTKE
jgi:hypothetical protein